jgi:hypothetical protein
MLIQQPTRLELPLGGDSNIHPGGIDGKALWVTDSVSGYQSTQVVPTRVRRDHKHVQFIAFVQGAIVEVFNLKCCNIRPSFS